MNKLMAIARAAIMLSLMGGSLPLRAQNPPASSDPDLDVPEKAGEVRCVKCPNNDPTNCENPNHLRICYADYLGGDGAEQGKAPEQAQKTADSESQGIAHDGREPDGGSLQGAAPMTAAAAANDYGAPHVSPAPRSGDFPSMSYSSGTYGAGQVVGAIPMRPLGNVPSGGAAARGQPISGYGGGGPISTGDQEGLRGPGLPQPKDGGQADDWARQLVAAWKSGDDRAAVQDLLEGIDADAAARGGAAYRDAVARRLLQTMGRDADAIARLMGSASYRRYQERFEQALQAGAKGDIERARAEFALALAALLGGHNKLGVALDSIVTVVVAVLAMFIFGMWQRRRQSRGAPA